MNNGLSAVATLALLCLTTIGSAEAQTLRLSGRVCVAVLQTTDANTRDWIQLFRMQTLSDKSRALSLKEVELYFKAFQPAQLSALRERCIATDPLATLPSPPPKRTDFPPTEVDHVHACQHIFDVASEQKTLGPDQKSAMRNLVHRATALDDMFYERATLSTRDVAFWRQYAIDALTKYRGEVIRYCASYYNAFFDQPALQ